MTNQNETSMPKGGNVSELEMVGALLFGSISDLDSVQENRMVNLGARIAPANVREWEDETAPASLLNAEQAAQISELAPERKSPKPVQGFGGNEVLMPAENVSGTSESEKPQTGAPVYAESTSGTETRNTRRNVRSVLFNGAFAVLTVCVAVLGWQLYAEKNETQTLTENTVAESEEMPSNAAAEISAPAETESIQNAPAIVEDQASMFAAVQTEETDFDQPTPAQPELAAAYPQFHAETAAAPQSVQAETAPQIGNAVTYEETYPTFNADLAQTAAPAVQSAPALCAQSPGYSPTRSVNPTAEYNPGAPMEEIPVFNSEISSFAPPASAPMNVAPMAPQVGTQAQIPAEAPRKLTVPQADPYQVPAVPAVPAAPAEEAYPTFNPNMGTASTVDSNLPVTYY